MEVWEAAACLGVGFAPPDGEIAPSGMSPESRIPGVPQEDLDLLRQRFAHSRGEGDAPQVSATNPELVSAMMSGFRQ